MQDTIIHAVCWTLLHSLWQGLLLAVCAGILLLLSKKSAAALRYNLLVGLLIFFTITVTFTFYLQMHAAEDAGRAAPVSGFTIQKQASTGQITGVYPGNNSLHSIIASFVEYFNTHASFVVLVWFCIFLARFVKIISGLVYVQRIRHYGTSPVPEEWQQKLKYLK